MSHVSGSLTGSRNTILELAQSIKNLLLLKKYLSFINLEEKNKSSWKQLWRNVSVVKFSLVEGLSKSASLRCFLLFLLFKKVKKIAYLWSRRALQARRSSWRILLFLEVYFKLVIKNY